MKTFELSESIDNKKVFIIQSSQLEGRLDVDFYKPEILELEYKVRSKASGKLSKYIAKIASGSTPSKTEEHRYYTTSELGIPFLRVQNLGVNGEISFTGLKYINEETHKGLLKRSQVSGGDLLVKITGVGRMAIASVAPENFVANTNQHMVVIKPKNISSKYLAQYLNLDLVEKLASRRSTGGTRPALDYPALKSIPIIEDIDFSKLNDAYLKQKRILKEANEKLASIDAYLLDKLGVEHEQKKINVESRIFTMPFRNLVGKRFDPIYYNSDLDQFNKGKFTSTKLKTLIKEFSSGQGVGRQDQVSEDVGILQIRPTNLGPRGSFLFQKNIFVPDEARHKRLQKGDVIFNNTNSQELVGKSAYWDVDLEATYSNHITVLRVDEIKIFPEYLALILNLYQKANIFYSICTNWNNQSGVGIDVFLDLNIPLPPLALQEEIISHIRKIRYEAKNLETEANLVLENAKQEIEKMILGETE